MRTFSVILMLVMVVVFGFQAQSYANSVNDIFIIVRLEERALRLVAGTEILKKFPVRIGKKTTPTPIGTGYISKKRKRPVFRYQDPPNRDKVIRHVTLDSGRIVDISSVEMRALGFRIYGLNTNRFSIHSTSFRSTIGKNTSNGCIGLHIEDMLELYPLVKEGMKIVIEP